MRKTFTTVLGIIAIALGALGAIFVTLNLVLNAAALTNERAMYLGENCVALLTKLTLIGTGILLLRRSGAARVLLIATLLLSCIDSVVIYQWFMPQVPAGLSPAGHAGRAFGHILGLVLGPILYVAALFYLALPTSRMEFSRNDMLSAPLL